MSLTASSLILYFQVTVFDFSTILERTEKRVRDDLLGAGPKTVDELRSIAGRLRLKYQSQLERKIQRANQQEEKQKEGTSPAGGGLSSSVKLAAAMAPPPQLKGAMDKAGSMASGLFAKVKSTKFSTSFAVRQEESRASNEPPATIVDIPPLDDMVANNNIGSSATAGVKPAPASGSTEGDWLGTDIAPATDAISNFSIGDEDDDDPDLLL